MTDFYKFRPTFVDARQMVFFQLVNVFNARSGYESAFKDLFSNPWIWRAVLLSAVLQAVVIYVPFLQKAFGTRSLSWLDWVVCIVVSSSVLWVREISKMLWPKRPLPAAAGKQTRYTMHVTRS